MHRFPAVPGLIDYKLECKADCEGELGGDTNSLIDYKLECKDGKKALAALRAASLIDYKLECKAVWSVRSGTSTWV